MIIVNVKFFPKENKKEEIIKLANDYVSQTREHEGNIGFEFYDNTQKNELMLFEQWESFEVIEKHHKSEIFHEFNESVKDLLRAENKGLVSFDKDSDSE
ncbi:MAG: antibiotic biosynthesis monooxygenase [Methanosphaera sp.]|nr:antibiotic biosynthesis monooxygenase [Methanosphaera sp.]